jgi:PPOX class probable F420-dependent enzyme
MTTQTVSLPAGVKALFEGKNFAHVATINPDGSPQVSVVWVDVEGDSILVNTAEGRIKPRNVRRDPRVAISIHSQDNPYQSATVQGEVIELRHEGADAHIDKLAKKYMGVDVYPNRRADEQRVILVIRSDQVAGMGV